MKNAQVFCDKCQALLEDKKEGVELPRHSILTVFGYSACGEWGFRENAVELKSDDGLCDKCFGEWWELAMNFRKWKGLLPISPRER